MGTGRPVRYELFVGLRYLKARRGQRILSLITWISIGGVAVGVRALMVVRAVMSGFERDLRAKILGVNAHIWVMKFGDKGLDDPDRVLREVQATPGVVGAVPFTYHQVMLSAPRSAAGAVLRGMDLAGGAAGGGPPPGPPPGGWGPSPPPTPSSSSPPPGPPRGPCCAGWTWRGPPPCWTCPGPSRRRTPATCGARATGGTWTPRR